MSYLSELKALLRATGKTQTELAGLLRVSFQTLNSWLHERSQPRKKAQEQIYLLYQQYTGIDLVDTFALDTKKKRIEELKRQFPNPLKRIIVRKDIYDTFVLELTYHTNSIEGSTLSEPEVRAVIFDNVTISNKTAIEHLEAKNHQAALGYLFRHLDGGDVNMTESHIKKLHAILMNSILPDAGEYRSHPVRIAGSRVVTANHLKVPERMKGIISGMRRSPSNVYAHLAKVHAEFEQIHPFSDGNGRVGRLLLHHAALQHGLPPVLIKREQKQAYYTYLERAQTQDEPIFLESFICDGLPESYELLG